MPDSRVRLAAIGRVLKRARRGARALDRSLMGLEVLNSTADRERGPATWDRMRQDSRAAFVLSTGRTGTTSLTHLLGDSPHVLAHHEPDPRLIALSYLAWTGAQDDAFWRDAVSLERDRLVFEALKTGRLYFEASNRMTFLAPTLAEVYPRSRFLLVTRRARPFVQSALRRGFYLGHPWDHARLRPTGGWSDQTAEQKAAWLWSETYRFALGVRDRFPDRALVLHAEDLFDGNVSRVHDVFDFLGVPRLPSARARDMMARPTNAQKGLLPWGREPDWSGDPLAGTAELERLLGYDDSVPA